MRKSVIFWKRQKILKTNFSEKIAERASYFYHLFIFFRKNQHTDIDFDVQYSSEKSKAARLGVS